MRVKTSGLRRYVALETAVGGAINVAMSLAASVASGGGRLGPPHVAGVLAQTFMVAFMSVLLATLLTRMRGGAGRCAVHRDLRLGVFRLAPRSAFLRASLAGVSCLAVAAPIVVAALPGVPFSEYGPIETGVATAVYALCLSLLTIPLALILELTGEPDRK